MAYEPPPFMPYEPFLLGVGVVFNLLICLRGDKLLLLQQKTPVFTSTKGPVLKPL